MRQPYRTALFASLILVICAGVLWAAYDWFQGRYLRAFSEHTAVFSGDPLKLPADLAGTLVLTDGAVLSGTWINGQRVRDDAVEHQAGHAVLFGDARKGP